MFDVGISELGVIGVVALIVIGPEQLPRVARTAGHLMGRLRRYVADVKSDIGREMDAAEFKRMQQEIQTAAGQFEQDMNQGIAAINEEAQVLAAPVTDLAQHIHAPTLVPAQPEQGPEPLSEDSAIEANEDQPDLFAPPEEIAHKEDVR